MKDYLINEHLRELLIQTLSQAAPSNAGHSFNLHHCLGKLTELKPHGEEAK